DTRRAHARSSLLHSADPGNPARVRKRSPRLAQTRNRIAVTCLAFANLGTRQPDAEATPPLSLTETSGCVRLELGQLARGEGRTPPQPGDHLIRRFLRLVFAVRSSGSRASCEVQPDPETMDFLYELGELVASG